MSLCDFWLSDLLEWYYKVALLLVNSCLACIQLGWWTLWGKKSRAWSDILHDGTKYYTCTKILKTNAKSFNVMNKQGIWAFNVLKKIRIAHWAKKTIFCPWFRNWFFEPKIRVKFIFSQKLEWWSMTHTSLHIHEFLLLFLNGSRMTSFGCFLLPIFVVIATWHPNCKIPTRLPPKANALL